MPLIKHPGYGALLSDRIWARGDTLCLVRVCLVVVWFSANLKFDVGKGIYARYSSFGLLEELVLYQKLVSS